MENEDVIIAFFKTQTNAVSAGQIADATAIARKDVDKVMARLKKSGQIESPKNCYWQWKQD